MHHWTVHGKVEFPKFPPDVRSWGSIQQLLILNSEMRSKIFPIGGGGHSTEWAHSQNLTLFPFILRFEATKLFSNFELEEKAKRRRLCVVPLSCTVQSGTCPVPTCRIIAKYYCSISLLTKLLSYCLIVHISHITDDLLIYRRQCVKHYIMVLSN